MTVKELIELLQKENQNDLVVLSTDGEGNGYNEVYSVEQAVYNTDYRSVKIKHLTPHLIEKGYSEEDLCHGDKCVNCVVIYP